ncbi:hypothetical protein RF11_13545 [Thelohanellus kitauei]|uniref:Reverse transcriptase/retrotransposon-derived protein RNase H-like domain-containing protein n=1 Tax=Thelohanellus kitauei TaxID=669202 RepID=A0A0C2MLT0_THEKT|nr:hypothetical protein RF11_13545 [Thelohanellus kitauei]
MYGTKRVKLKICAIAFAQLPGNRFEHPDEVFKKKSNAGLKLKISKCKFCFPEINYNGFIVSSEEIKPDNNKINPIKDRVKPKRIKELLAVLAVCGYYQRLVKNYEDIIYTLYRILNKSIPWIWNTVYEHSFSDIKKKLVEIQSLNYPKWNLTLNLYCDASDHAMGVYSTNGRRNRKTYFILQWNPMSSIKTGTLPEISSHFPNEFFESCHSKSLSHVEINETIDAIREIAWWPKMSSDITNYDNQLQGMFHEQAQKFHSKIKSLNVYNNHMTISSERLISWTHYH